MKKLIFVTALGVSLLACEPPAPPATDAPVTPAPTDTAAASAAMQDVYARFSAGYRLASADTVAQLYTEDAFYLQPDADVLRGRDTVRATFEAFLGGFREGGRPGPNIDFEILERRIDGDIGHDVGYYRFDGVRAGKFIVLWRRGEDGQWRISADGFSGLAPRPAQ